MNAMSSALDLLRTGTRTKRTRLLMVGAVLGAVAALFISMASASPGSNGSAGDGFVPGPEGGGPASPDAAHGTRYAFDAPVGSCLNWQRDDGADMREVECKQGHLFEVTGVVDVGNTYPAGSALPGSDTWRTLATKRCTKGAEEYLHDELDPKGKLSVAALRPNEHNWKRGNRQLRCGLWRVGPGGSLQGTKGRAADIDQSDVWATGTCLALAKGNTVGDPINCREKHSYEMIAVIDLSEEFEKWPNTDKQDKYLDETCAKAAGRYAGGNDLKKLKLIVSWDIRAKSSWAAGSHLVNCKVAALLDDASGLAAVTGSIKDAGPKEKPKPTKTSSKPSN